MNTTIIDVQAEAFGLLRVTFADGEVGMVDLSSELWGPMFEPLLDLNLFKQASIHPETGAITWPNGADIAPEFIEQHVRVANSE